MTARRNVIAGFAGAAALAFVVVSSRAPLRFVSVDGAAVGNGMTSSPFDMVVHVDSTTVTGTGAAGSPLSVDAPSLDGFTFFMFGDGSDGDCNWDGVTTVVGDAPAAVTANETVHPGQTTAYSISGFRFCQDAYVASTVAVNAGWPIYVAGTLTLDGIIHRNGLHPSANTTSGGAYGAGWTTATAPGGGIGTGCGRMSDVFYDSTTSLCATGVTPISGNGNNGTNGTPGLRPGCGGNGGSRCSATSGAGGAPGSMLSGSSLLIIGHSDLWQADGYYDRPFGNTTTMCGGSGGGIGDSTSSAAFGGGGGGHLIVHSKKVVGAGALEARGGDGWTNTVTTQCPGGGGGGGGGIVTAVIGGGSPPTISVAGGAGGPGTICVTGSCIGLHGGAGANGRDGYAVLYNLGLF